MSGKAPSQADLDKFARMKLAYEDSTLSLAEIAFRFGYFGAGSISAIAKKRGWKIRGNGKQQLKRRRQQAIAKQLKEGIPPMLPQLDEDKMKQRFHPSKLPQFQEAAPVPLDAWSELAPRSLDDRLTQLHLKLDRDLGLDASGHWQADRWQPGKRKEPEL